MSEGIACGESITIKGWNTPTRTLTVMSRFCTEDYWEYRCINDKDEYEICRTLHDHDVELKLDKLVNS